MARLSKSRSLVRSDVRRIRDRHLQALRAGYSKEEAAAFANGDEPLRKKVKAKAPVVVENQHDEGITKARDVLPQRSSVSGRIRIEDIQDTDLEKEKQPKEQNNDKIPKDWQELPWPQLKVLAENLSGVEVKSRKQANEIIDSALSEK